mgnify:CR=1 FL=1
MRRHHVSQDLAAHETEECVGVLHKKSARELLEALGPQQLFAISGEALGEEERPELVHADNNQPKGNGER